MWAYMSTDVDNCNHTQMFSVFLQCNNIILKMFYKDRAAFSFKCEQIIFIMNKSDLPSALLWQEISPLFQSQMT